MTVLARKQGAALVIRERALGIFTDKGFTPVDFKVELAMKLAARLKYTPVLPAQEMEEADLLRFLEDSTPG
jgi:phosphoribosylaminoimidazole-succinocarboxamide synthase